MENQEKAKAVPADLLALATQAPKEQLTEVNPFDYPPLIKVGKEWTPGMVITGYYSETVTIATPGSKYADTADAHVLRVGSPTGKKLGMWSVGELGAFFKDMAPGTLVSITYVSKGVNAQGNDQHFFKFHRNGVQ